MLFWILLILVFGLYYLLTKPYQHWRKKGVSQGQPLPFFGDTINLAFKNIDMGQMVKRLYDQFPDERYYGTYQFISPKLVIKDPELIKNITVKDFDHFVDHVPMGDPDSDPLFGKNLLVLKGDQWRQMRSTLTGSFTSSKMKIMFNLMTEAAENFVNYFKNQEIDDEFEVEMKDAFSRYTIDVIATTSFGVQVNSLAEKDNQFFLLGQEVTEIKLPAFFKILVFMLAPKLYKRFGLTMFRKEVNDFFTSLVNDTIQTREERHIYRPDMLQILMEARKGIEKEDPKVDNDIGFAVTKEYVAKSKVPQNITNEDITAQALIFFFAGFDSVSSAMTFTTYELAMNPTVQNKLRDEIRLTLEEFDGKVTYEAIAAMKYMDMVISESLRKWPPFVTIGRECTKPYVIEPSQPGEKKLFIPKGTAIQIPVWAIQRDPKYFPDPEKFVPERFSQENREKLVPYTFLGFGVGPRSCLGTRFALLEVKIIIFYILNSFELVLTEKTQVPLKLSKKFSINIRPEKGLYLGLKKLC